MSASDQDYAKYRDNAFGLRIAWQYDTNTGLSLANNERYNFV
ncbi:MAG: hypothetical protein U0640_11675 [Phycisphaerales bacterium]